MGDALLNDAFHTDGNDYRIPAEPLLISALGRALWNFLSIEEMVVAILYESGEDIVTARKESAGGKANALIVLRATLKEQNAPIAVLDAI